MPFPFYLLRDKYFYWLNILKRKVTPISFCRSLFFLPHLIFTTEILLSNYHHVSAPLVKTSLRKKLLQPVLNLNCRTHAIITHTRFVYFSPHFWRPESFFKELSLSHPFILRTRFLQFLEIRFEKSGSRKVVLQTWIFFLVQENWLTRKKGGFIL